MALVRQFECLPGPPESKNETYLFLSLLLNLFLSEIQAGFLLIFEKPASQSQDVSASIVLRCWYSDSKEQRS